MKREQKTAIHETGHFIAYLLYVTALEGWEGMECKALSIVPDWQENSWGRLEPAKEFIYSDMREQNVKLTLAGYAADMIREKHADAYTYLSNRIGKEMTWKGSDAHSVVDLLLYHVPDGGQFEDVAAPYFSEVVHDLRTYWDVVMDVADHLLRQKHIEGEDLDELAYKTAQRLGIDTEPDNASPGRLVIPPL